jgi:DNA-directed RNA polymerase alpha subunit
MEEQLFKVDYSKIKFRIGIDVCENGTMLYVFDTKPGYTVSYHEIIGVLESIKNGAVLDQREQNRKSETLKDKDMKQAESEFDSAYKNHTHPNDCHVGDAKLSTRIKTAISQCCVGGLYEQYYKDEFSNKRFSQLMLSDLIKVPRHQWLKIRNFGKKSYVEMKDYLSGLGFEIK